jgi:fluoroacetyl-CoA thioesterase
MAKPVPIGAHGSCEERVQFASTLSAHNHELPPVYSTPDMIRLMETAGYYALRPFCEPGEISVGTAIHVEHRAPAGINSVVKAEATVESIDGRFYVLRVTAKADKKEIGHGTITRAIVQTAGFLEKYGITKP